MSDTAQPTPPPDPLAAQLAALNAQAAERDAPHLATLSDATARLQAILASEAATQLRAQIDALIADAAPAASAVIGDIAKARAVIAMGALRKAAGALKPVGRGQG